MTRDEVIEVCNQVFVRDFEVPEEDLQPQARLFEEFELDSLDTVDLIVALQEAFDVSIRNDQRIQNIRTLEDVHNFVISIQQEAESGN